MLSTLTGDYRAETLAIAPLTRYSQYIESIHLPPSSTAVSHPYQAKIYVTLRPSVLDPAGTAIQSGLSHMGYANVDQVRIGKYIELTLTAADQAQAEEQVDRMCDQLLANPVIENYRYELTQLEQPAAAGA